MPQNIRARRIVARGEGAKGLELLDAASELADAINALSDHHPDRRTRMTMRGVAWQVYQATAAARTAEARRANADLIQRGVTPRRTAERA